MQVRTIEYYHWDDIVIEICKRLNIESKDFRNYRIGYGILDLWHVWLDIGTSEGIVNFGDITDFYIELLEYEKDSDDYNEVLDIYVRDYAIEEDLIIRRFANVLYDIAEEYNIKNIMY